MFSHGLGHARIGQLRIGHVPRQAASPLWQLLPPLDYRESRQHVADPHIHCVDPIAQHIVIHFPDTLELIGQHLQRLLHSCLLEAIGGAQRPQRTGDLLVLQDHFLINRRFEALRDFGILDEAAPLLDDGPQLVG